METTTLVTGGAGFIGANLIRRLVAEGRRVVVADDFSRATGENLHGLPVQIARVDLRNFDEASKVVAESECVYHLAAKVGSIDYLHGSERAEREALQWNLAIDVNVIRACVECNIPKIVYPSSSSVYPVSRQQEFGIRFEENDTDPRDPEGGYGWAKLMGEYQLDLAENCKSGIARIFSAYGEFSELGRTAQVVSALIRKALNYPNEPFLVWGDGSQTRNCLYVDDCIDALLKLEQHASYPPLKVNIGNPETVTIKELAEEIVSISHKTIRVIFDPSRPMGPMSRIPNIAKAERELGWKPKTPLRKGLERTYQWAERVIASGTKRVPVSGPN